MPREGMSHDAVRRSPPGLHADRAVGGDRHHRRAHRPLAAGRPIRWEGNRQNQTSAGYAADHGGWADPENKITIEFVCRGSQVINCTNGNEIYSSHPGGANLAFGDGAIRFVREDVAPATFVALYSRNGR